MRFYEGLQKRHINNFMKKENLEVGEVSLGSHACLIISLEPQHGVDEDKPSPGDHCQSDYGN